MHKRTFLLFSTFLFCLLCGCAKREVDTKIILDFADVSVLHEKQHSQIQCSFGPENQLLVINAELFVPDKIVSGKVKDTFPDIAAIQKVLRDDKTVFEQQGQQEWGITQAGAGHNEIYYGYNDMYASFYDTVPVQRFDDSDAFLKELGYSAVFFHKQTGEEDTYYYSPGIDDIPVVSQHAGFGGTQVYMRDNKISSFLLEPQYSLLETQEEQQVISEKCAIEILGNAYINGQISPLNGEKIQYMRLAYFVDKQKNLFPVWCFSIVFDNREYVMYCIQALDGTVLFDYNHYSVAGEEES
ncbi:MAG: hypothetical protein ACI4EK_02525 [Wujia sp.]